MTHFWWTPSWTAAEGAPTAKANGAIGGVFYGGGAYPTGMSYMLIFPLGYSGE